MDIEEMDVEDLESKWVETFNSFDSYDDKQLWRDELKYLKDRIKNLET
ncbi:hypothetical protein GCM10023314_27820 [Algibacter agarivorans]|uniref:Uncharacterized protein n=1 Tax=Algibacter agarivorans TaxID=1109741 RepID=A0ABP9GT40_9FLAO